MESKPYEAITTCTKKPGLAQIVSYLVFILETVCFFAVAMPQLEGSSKIVLTVIYCISLVVLVVSTLICSIDDPSDDVMIAYRNRPRLDYEQYRRTYEGKLLFCDYCRSFVKQKSRHCKACDRCVYNFDHHCMWINNCIGRSNYRPFFVMILGAFSNLVVYVAAVAVLTSQGNYNEYIVGFVVAWISGAINTVFSFLLLNLIFLHIYLFCKDMSTYQFIMAQRQQEKREKEEEEARQRGKTKEQDINLDMRSDQLSNEMNNKHQHTANVILIKTRDKPQEEPLDTLMHHERISANGSSSNQGNIFGERDITQKSDGKISEGERPQQSSEDGQSSLEISQIFTRNKSLKLILGKNQYYKPHPVVHEPIRGSRSRSMLEKIPKIK